MFYLNTNLRIRGRFDTKGFEECIQDLVERYTGDKDTLLMEDLPNEPVSTSKM